jgi:lipopolysaccharide heptosyltransferase II
MPKVLSRGVTWISTKNSWDELKIKSMGRIRFCMNKIHVIKKVDKFWGRILCLLLRKPEKTDTKKITASSFLVIRPGGLGDAILTIPVMCALKQNFPDASITVLAEKRNAPAFGLCPHVNQVLLYDNLKELLVAIRGKYDVVIDTEQWHRLSAVVARLTRSPLSIGYATNERNNMFSSAVQYFHEDYEMDSFYRLLEPLGIIPSKKVPPYLSISDAAVKSTKGLLGVLADKPFVAIFPGASVPEKRWDVKSFVNLALDINRAGYPIVVVGSEKERSAGEAISHGLNSLNLAGKTSLVETVALIDKSSLLVSGDSGVLHIAVGLGKPTVSLFGPSNLKKWAPKGERHIVINENLPCSPCTKFGYTPKCTINAKCMRDITVDEVVEAVMRLMKSNFDLRKR